MQAYNNALSQYQSGTDGLQNYIKSKGEAFRERASSKIAEALDIKAEDKEEMENLLSTASFAAPLVFEGGKKLVGKAKSTWGKLTQKGAEDSKTPVGSKALTKAPIKKTSGGVENIKPEEARPAATANRPGTPSDDLEIFSDGKGGTLKPGETRTLPEGADDFTDAEEEDDEGDDVGGGNVDGDTGGETEEEDVDEGGGVEGDEDESKTPDMEPTFSSKFGDTERVNPSGEQTQAYFGDDTAGGFVDRGFRPAGAPDTLPEPTVRSRAPGTIGGDAVSKKGSLTGGDDEGGSFAKTAGEDGVGKGTNLARTAGEDVEDVAEKDNPELAGLLGAENVTQDLIEGKNVGSSLVDTAKNMAIGGAVGTAATLALGAEVAVPALAAYAVGDSLYSLFTGKYKEHDDAPTQVEYSTSGISDIYTKGGFAAASMDGVTTQVSANSAF
jgi:hypothetical protein